MVAGPLVLLAGALIGLFSAGPTVAADPASTRLASGSTRIANLARQPDRFRPPPEWSVERPIEPGAYRVVPGDLLRISIEGELPIEHRLVIDPEGNLRLPRAGTIRLSPLTLDQAERAVRERLAPLYPRAEITLGLLEPGRFRVPIAGLVQRPGIYEVTAFDRLSAALALAGGPLPGGSLRRIRIDREAGLLAEAEGGLPPGGRREIDLCGWLAAGDLSFNPTLAPGDAILVPPRKSTVRVRGAVNGRGILADPTLGPRPLSSKEIQEQPLTRTELTFEWLPGETVASALALAGGLSHLATGQGRLHRPGAAIRELDLGDPSATDLQLAPGDLLEVMESPRWVYVVGAVSRPGAYAYFPGYRAADYVALAGGWTDTGRDSGWKWIDAGGRSHSLKPKTVIEPGSTLRIPQRRSYQISNLLSPVTTATALVISVIALRR